MKKFKVEKSFVYNGVAYMKDSVAMFADHALEGLKENHSKDVTEIKEKATKAKKEDKPVEDTKDSE